MTTKQFSAIKLPHPKYKLEVGRLNLRKNAADKTLLSSNKPEVLSKTAACNRVGRKKEKERLSEPSATSLPRFSHTAHVIEVKDPGNTIPGHVGSHIKDFLGQYVVIDNARPELFLRRDFISKFILRGKVFVTQSSSSSNHYKFTISDNGVMVITMGGKEYRRFGLVARRTVSLPDEEFGKGEKCYRIEIDLRDSRLLKSNKYQDKMMSTLRRLTSINNIYFRFFPDDKSASDLSIAAANEFSVEYFKYIIEEYALDGCEPVPLTGCSAVCQRIERHWLNCAQLHPRLDLAQIVRHDGRLISGEEGDEELSELVGIVDWLGYQLLSLDCDLDEIKSEFPDGGRPRVDVSCTKIVSSIDSHHTESNLYKLFGTKRHEDRGVILRALILYNDQYEHVISSNVSRSENISPYSNVCNNSGVVYIQDCTHGSRAASEITVIGLCS